MGIESNSLAIVLNSLFVAALLEELVAGAVIDVGDKLGLAPLSSVRVVQMALEVEAVGQDMFDVYGAPAGIEDGENVGALAEGVLDMECLYF